jgi:PAS domain S-box-containing protein
MAIAMTAITAVIAHAIPYPQVAPFLLFYAAIALSSWLGGRGPGFAATLLSGVLANYHFLPPTDGFSLGGAELISTLLFLASGFIVAFLSGSLRVELRDTERKRAEEGLARFELLAEQSRDTTLFVRREDGRILEANAAATRAYGYSRDELLSLSIQDLRAPETRSEVAARMAEADHHGTLFETTHRRKDGSTFPVEVSCQGSFIGGRRVLVAVIRDISDRRRAQSSLVENMKNLELLSTSATRFLEPMSTSELFHYAALQVQAVAGRAVVVASEYDPATNQTVVQAVVGPDEKLHKGTALLGRDPVGLAFVILERIRAQMIGGGLAKVEGGLCGLILDQWPAASCHEIEQEVNLGDAYAMPFAFEDDLLGTVAILTDRDEGLKNREVIEALVNQVGLALQRRRAEEELRFQLDLIQGIAQNAAESIFVIDERGRVSFANAEAQRVFGFSFDELKGKILHDLIHHRRPDGSVFPSSECPISKINRSGETVHGHEDIFYRKDGSSVTVSCSNAPLEVRGRRSGSVLVVRDITERRQMEETLREADRRRNAFLGMLSHELRNPLTPIKSGIYILNRNPGLDERGRRAAAVIDRQVNHLTRLIDDLLDVTRITRGKIHLQRTRLDLAEVVRRVVDDHRSLLEARRVSVRLPSEPLWIHADGTRITQVAANLLNNAAKYTSAGAEVTVSAFRSGTRQAMLEVTDTGIGIDPETLASLFQPFTQADRSLDRSRGGLGLGLALVKGLVELHGGTVNAYSKGPGQGSRFTVAFPLDERGERAEGALRGPRLAKGIGRKVLVIEDNVDAADSLAELLELAGHRIAVAYTGKEGIEKARTFGPEIVLCDIGLPQMDGYQVARAFREDEALRTTYLIALSGFAQPEDQSRAAQAGFDAHLAKPPDINALSNLIGAAPLHFVTPPQ